MRAEAASRRIAGLQKRLWIFPGLAILTLIGGQLCKTSCSFLEGDILGVDLNLFGGSFYALLFAAAVYRSISGPAVWITKAIAAAVSVGMGGELIFIKFQVEHSTYCPKCLISGFFLLVMFFLMIPHLRKWLIILLVAAGALFTSFTFNGSVVPSYAAEAGDPEFGNAKAQTEVVLYSDYRCPACGKVDESVNKALLRLKDKIRIRFVDVPGHPGSMQYAEVFLYSWFKSGSGIETALKVRQILFEEAKNKTDQKNVIEILKSRGVALQADEAAAREIFRQRYNPLMKTDKISATPTLVVVKGGERKKYVGGEEILKALAQIQ